MIDRTCALSGCEYEWGVHVTAFGQAAKLTPEQVEATVTAQADAPCWSAAEQALIAAVDALHARAALSDAEFTALRAHYDEAQVVEVLLLAGFYRTVAYLVGGLGLELEEMGARFPGA